MSVQLSAIQRNTMFSISRSLLLIIFVISVSYSQVWTHAFGFQSASNNISSTKAVTDNCILIAGHNYDSLAVFDTVLTSNGLYDCYIIKIDTNGSLLQLTSFGGTGPDKIYDLDANSASDYVITGSLQKTVTIGDTTFTAPVTESFFLAEFTTDGSFKWGTVEAMPSGTAVRYLSDNSIVVAGNFIDTVAISGEDTLRSNGDFDIFLLKFSSEGTRLWSQHLGGTKSDYVTALDVSPDNDIYMTGVFYDTLHIDSITIIAESSFEQSYVIKMDASGNVQWVRRFLSEHSLQTTSLSVDENGDCFVTGRFMNNALVDTAVLDAEGEYAGFLCKLTPDGDLEWIDHYSLVTCNNLIPGDNDDLFLIGNFKKKTTFGDITVESHDIEDVFIVNVTRNGNYNWVQTAGGCRASYGKTIAVNNAHLFIAGYADRQMVEKNCPMQFGSNVVQFSNDDQGRSFVAICNHTIENSVFKPLQFKNKPTVTDQIVKIYDLKGRDISGIPMSIRNKSGDIIKNRVYLHRVNGRTFRSLVIE